MKGGTLNECDCSLFYGLAMSFFFFWTSVTCRNRLPRGHPTPVLRRNSGPKKERPHSWWRMSRDCRPAWANSERPPALRSHSWSSSWAASRQFSRFHKKKHTKTKQFQLLDTIFVKIVLSFIPAFCCPCNTSLLLFTCTSLIYRSWRRNWRSKLTMRRLRRSWGKKTLKPLNEQHSHWWEKNGIDFSVNRISGIFRSQYYLLLNKMWINLWCI